MTRCAWRPGLCLIPLLTVTLTEPAPAQQDIDRPTREEAPAAQGEESIGELVTDRPDVTESTNIVAPGWFQMEVGGSVEGEEGGSETLALPGSLLRIGVTRRIEARLGWDGYHEQNGRDPAPAEGGDSCPCEASGTGDGQAALKVLLLDRSGPIPDFALLPSITLPIGDEPFTSGSADPGFKLLFANDLSPRVGWGANVGAEWPSGERLLSWSASFGFGLAESLAAFAELFGEDGAGEPAAHSLDGGLTFAAGPHLQLDASGGIGLNEAAPDWLLGAGLAFRFAY